MDLKRMLSGKWLTRLVLMSWIICAVAIFVVFKNMELIVHGQLYSYGLVFSPEWADAYRVFTWLIFICLGIPMVLSGLALASSFVKVENIPKKANIVPQNVGLPRGVVKVESPPTVKVESPPIVKETPKIIENGNCSGISCPDCHRAFGRALVMLDFRGGKNQMVSVCPYCSHVLGHTGEEKATTESIHVASFDE